MTAPAQVVLQVKDQPLLSAISLVGLLARRNKGLLRLLLLYGDVLCDRTAKRRVEP